MAGYNYAQNIIGLKKGAGDIHELELEVAQLSASVLSIGEKVDGLSASNLPYSSTQSTKQKIDEVSSSDVTELVFTPVSTVTVSTSTIKRDGRVKMCLLRLDITNISNNTETKIGVLSGFSSGQYISGNVISAHNTRTVGSFVLSGRDLFCRLLSDATESEKSNISISIYSID